MAVNKCIGEFAPVDGYCRTNCYMLKQDRINNQSYTVQSCPFMKVKTQSLNQKAMFGVSRKSCNVK